MPAGGCEPPGAHDTFAIPPLPPGMPMVAVFLDLGGAVSVSMVADTTVPGPGLLPPLLHDSLTALYADVLALTSAAGRSPR